MNLFYSLFYIQDSTKRESPGKDDYSGPGGCMRQLSSSHRSLSNKSISSLAAASWCCYNCI